MKNKFLFLNIVAATGVGLGIFQLLASLGVFKQLSGILFYLPLVLLWPICFFTLKCLLEKRSKKGMIVLIVLTFLGFFAASFWGHKAFEQQVMNQKGVIRIQ